MDRQTKLEFVPTVARNSSGLQASRNSIASRICEIRPSAARPVGTNASSEILRACDILRAVLLRDDEDFADDEPDALIDKVRNGIAEVVERLQSLAGDQMLFEAWNKS